MAIKTIVEERRRFSRHAFSPDLGISVLSPEPSILVGRLNCSEGGLCIRLEKAPEVRSMVLLQWDSDKHRARSAKMAGQIEFTGRVAWVIQRLDLRVVAPFVYDVGVEFVDPPALLRQIIARREGRQTAGMERSMREKMIPPAHIRDRDFIPRLARDGSQPARWHLVVMVDGSPCFSERYASERSAIDAWVRFKRQQARR